MLIGRPTPAFKDKQLILKHRMYISVDVSSQDFHYHQISIWYQLLNVLGDVPSSSIKLDTYQLISVSKDISNGVHWSSGKKFTFRPTCH